MTLSPLNSDKGLSHPSPVSPNSQETMPHSHHLLSKKQTLSQEEILTMLKKQPRQRASSVAYCVVLKKKRWWSEISYQPEKANSEEVRRVHVSHSYRVYTENLLWEGNTKIYAPIESNSYAKSISVINPIQPE